MMGAASVHSFPVHKAHVATPPAAKSRGECPVDLHRLRTVFPDRWAALLRQHFNGDLLLIQVFFGVSERQARDWLAGKNAPSAPFAVLACCKIPGAIYFLTRAA